MYDIEGALRRRALAERLEALAQAPGASDDLVGVDGTAGMPGTTGDETVPHPHPAKGQTPSYAAPSAPVHAEPVPSAPGGGWSAGPRHRTPLTGDHRRGEPAAPSPYLTPVAEAPQPASGYVTASPYGLTALPGPAPVDLPADHVIDNTPVATGPSTLTAPSSLVTPGASPGSGPALRPPSSLPTAAGIPGATVAVTMVPGTPLPARSPGRSGAGRPGAAPSPAPAPAPAAALEAMAPAMAAGPAAPVSAGPAPIAPAPAPAPAPAENLSPADLASQPPAVGTAASAIADLLRDDSTRLLFRNKNGGNAT